VSYGYDANGNRISLGAGTTVISYTIDPGSNRLLGSAGSGTRSLSFDADGNVIVDAQPLINYAYTYDASGRLVTAKTGGYTTSYTNDGLGERVTRSGYGASTLPGGGEAFVYDQAGHLLGEYGASNGKAIQETVWLGDLPVAEQGPGNSRRYIAPDHLGSPHQITDPGRSPVWLWDHDPFGNGAPTGSFAYNLRFPGQYFDSETGLHYNGFRDYDPTTGRYVQSDPIGLKVGLNAYVYVAGDPVGATDFSGLDGSAPPIGQGNWFRNFIYDQITSYLIRMFDAFGTTFAALINCANGVIPAQPSITLRDIKNEISFNDANSLAGNPNAEDVINAYLCMNYPGACKSGQHAPGALK
jgi:RHS repeat-associated protein